MPIYSATKVLAFKAVEGNGYAGDIAIDDIAIVPSLCDCK